MKKLLLMTVVAPILTAGLRARAEDPVAIGITPNHQVNPPHAFKQLACVEKQSGGRFGLSIAIDVPNGADATATVFFHRPEEPKTPVATWSVKYVLDPRVYTSFANQFQKMDISRGPEDLFSLSLQLHSGNGSDGVFAARFVSPSLLGYSESRRAFKSPNTREMLCKFR